MAKKKNPFRRVATPAPQSTKYKQIFCYTGIPNNTRMTPYAYRYRTNFMDKRRSPSRIEMMQPRKTTVILTI
jgi:hypothetical protein